MRGPKYLCLIKRRSQRDGYGRCVKHVLESRYLEIGLTSYFRWNLDSYCKSGTGTSMKTMIPVPIRFQAKKKKKYISAIDSGS